jgi:hypothetical protein
VVVVAEYRRARAPGREPADMGRSMTRDTILPDHAALLEMEEPHDDDPIFLTSWESAFIESVSNQDYDITDRQQAKLEEIEQRIEERRNAWRNGLRWHGHWHGR